MKTPTLNWDLRVVSGPLKITPAELEQLEAVEGSARHTVPPTRTVTEILCSMNPKAVPVTITCHVPRLRPVTVSVEVPEVPGDRVTLTGLIPEEAVPEVAPADRDIVPENPLMLVNVTAALAELPTTTVRLVGFAEIVKSPVTVTSIVVAWMRLPFVAVTVTV
jgi:hypothetical protein